MKKKFLLIDAVVVLVGIGICVGWLVVKNTFFPVVPPKKTLAPIINKLSYAINGLSGRIDHVSGNTIYITVESSVQSGKPAIYLVHTTKETEITVSTPPVRYLLQPPKVISKKTRITDLLPGQYVTVTTSADIRSIDSNEIAAVSIAVTSLNEILGIVSDISNNDVITVIATPPTPLFAFQMIPKTSRQEQYLITVTKKTEISRYKASETNVLNAERLDFSFIKKGMTVRVFTDTDLTFSRTGNALHIEPLY